MNATVKNRSMGRTIAAIALAVTLGGCNGVSKTTVAPRWEIYTNPRYSFQFPYPSNWTALPAPDNGDGQAFVSLQNPEVDIRGWAGNKLPNWEKRHKNAQKTVNSNFQTAQGVSGTLTVEVGKQASTMKLTINQGQLRYYWQGRAPSQQFGNYYNAFYYIAQQYRIPK
jgi:hypothetical protein